MRSNEEFIMKPKVDFCFKELMEDAEVRRGFISAILHVKPEEIQETTLLPTYLRKTYPEEKYGILDVHVKITGEYAGEMDIEIQVAPFELWAERSLFYLCKMFHSRIEEGEQYEELNTCIHVGILDFTLFEGDEEFYSCFHLWEDRRRRKFTDKLEIHIIGLPKWNPGSMQGDTESENAELQSWTGFLGAESKPACAR
ncbi:MAG: Rpn family recombination-promoting nuclease/putative transposase [Lachnospiraceae bacterium]|nr:Rpn family recombination-promoting nuclease/putative transposase [Lachnospiraceae bacterium]